ncbi:MAG: helix-turn-helix domain-containing protein [Pseudomonadota bacterium]
MQEKSARRSNAARSKATRGALIETARRLFVEKGYAETGTPEIVSAAAVTRGALYHHFTDKAALFQAVIENEAAAVAAHIERRTGNPGSVEDAFVSGADAYFTAMAEPGRARLLLIDGPAVLGPAAMAEIDAVTGGRTLRDGLAYAFAGKPPTPVEEATLDALADLLSAAFDRAALSISIGRPPAAYHAAVRHMVSGMIRNGPPASN